MPEDRIAPGVHQVKIAARGPCRRLVPTTSPKGKVIVKVRVSTGLRPSGTCLVLADLLFTPLINIGLTYSGQNTFHDVF
jgi:hypothetical protein